MVGTDYYHILIELSDPHNRVRAYDYRYSPILLTSIDTPLNTTTIEKTSNKLASNMAISQVEPLIAKLLGEGVIRLYREYEDDEDTDIEFSTQEIDPSSVSSSSSQNDQNLKNVTSKRHLKKVSNPGDDTMVSIVAVPTYFTATDLLGFIGETYMKYITHIRILKSEKPNRFLVLIKFSDILKTAEFQLHFNGKLFNSMEPESCHVVFVKSIRFETDDYSREKSIEGISDTLIPFLLSDPFTSRNKSDEYQYNSSIDSPLLLTPEESSIELPTCPVCLERMDSTVTGLLTIACQHTFHCQCLSKWSDDTCPICRYSNNVSNQKVRRSVRRLLQYNSSRLQQQQQRLGEGGSGSSFANPLSLTGASDTVVETNEHCMECSNDANLWICLICGNVGCDRYAPEQHSLKHFINTGHCFAMELNTSRVWDYAGDNYVHRLVANESDGKIVELPDKNSASNGNSFFKSPAEGSTTNFDKIDEVGFEYSQLLISQLASQREYYEAILSEQSAPKSRRNSSFADNNTNQKALTNLEIKVEELSLKLTQVTLDTVPGLKAKIEAKDTKIQQLVKDLGNSDVLNEGLSKKIEYLTNENQELKTSNQELNEQVRDLMFFLESRDKFKDESQEVKDGTIVIPQNPKPSKSKQKKKRK